MPDDKFALSWAELRAIEDHKYFLSKERGKEVILKEAMADFQKYKQDWLKAKLKKESIEQRKAIEEFKRKEEEKAGYDLGELPVQAWQNTYAAQYRDMLESPERNEFIKRKVIICNEKGIHVRPSGTLAKISTDFDCDIYVHKNGMESYDFKVNGITYLDVNNNAILGYMSLEAAMGDELEFIAYGRQANEALNSIDDVIKKKFNE